MNGIKAGDLVVVIKGMPCCGRTDAVGMMAKVEWVAEVMRGCSYCGTWHIDVVAKLPIGTAQLYRLKKINPPPITKTTEHKEKIEA